jgi:hypothetical protein
MQKIVVKKVFLFAAARGMIILLDNGNLFICFILAYIRIIL